MVSTVVLVLVSCEAMLIESLCVQGIIDCAIGWVGAAVSRFSFPGKERFAFPFLNSLVVRIILPSIICSVFLTVTWV